MSERSSTRKTIFSHRKHGRALQGLTAGLIVGVLVSILHLAGVFQRFESSLADVRRLHFTSGTPGTNTVHINVTQACLDSLKNNDITWPWPREAWARIVDYLAAAGARTIVFDLLFTEFSSRGVEDDRMLIRAISNAGTAVFSAQFSQPIPETERGKALVASNREAQTSRARAIRDFALPVRRMEEDAPLMRYAFLEAYPYEEYLPHIAALGNVHLHNDADSIARRKRLAFEHYGTGFMDLALAGLMRTLDIREIRVFSRRMELVGSKGILRSIPLDSEGNLSLKFYGPFRRVYNPRKHNFFLASEVINASIEPESWTNIRPEYFKNKIVLLGTDAPGLKDIRPNPFSNIDGGVYLYSTAIENILAGSYVVEHYEHWLTILLIILLSVLTGYVGARLSVIRGVLASLAIALTYSVVAILLFSGTSVLIEMASILTATLLSFIVGAVRNYYVESRQKHFIQGAFSQVLAPAILDKLMEDPASLTLGGDSKELTIFFSDLAGFTTLSEALGSPQRLVAILNEYLTAMADIIMDYDGYVDKYEGDAIMAFWGAPVDDPAHAWKGCYAALDNQKKLTELQARFVSMGLPGGLAVRIGLNTGVAVAGMMGSMKKLNYTIIGDPVNLASRLEGANKQYGTRIMVSDSTRIAAGDKIITRPLDLIRVKGKTEPTAVHELVAKSGEASQQHLDLIGVFSEALNHYRESRFAEALARFEAVRGIQPDDPPSLVYIDRCRHFLVSPPPAPWDGVFTMTSK